MEGMTQVSVESADAKALLPGYITVVVMSACAKSSGITEGACFTFPLLSSKLPSHYKKILVTNELFPPHRLWVLGSI